MTRDGAESYKKIPSDDLKIISQRKQKINIVKTESRYRKEQSTKNTTHKSKD